MRVPKMVKNGHNSVLHISASAQEDSGSKKSRTDTKPKTFLESWKANKNHFRPISEQACALVVGHLPSKPCDMFQYTTHTLQRYLQKPQLTFVLYDDTISYL
jgi:hypothetical protein